MSAAPHEVILTFTERLEAAFSNLTVVDASGTEVSQGYLLLGVGCEGKVMKLCGAVLVAQPIREFGKTRLGQRTSISVCLR
jgi:hypothetical protein